MEFCLLGGTRHRMRNPMCTLLACYRRVFASLWLLHMKCSAEMPVSYAVQIRHVCSPLFILQCVLQRPHIGPTMPCASGFASCYISLNYAACRTTGRKYPRGKSCQRYPCYHAQTQAVTEISPQYGRQCHACRHVLCTPQAVTPWLHIRICREKSCLL